MTLLVIPVASQAAGLAISEGLWRLTRPETVAASDQDSTRYAFPVEPQPGGGWALLVDPAADWPVHGRAIQQLLDPTDAEGSRARLSALASALGFDAAQVEALRTQIIATRRVRPAELLQVKPQ